MRASRTIAFLTAVVCSGSGGQLSIHTLVQQDISFQPSDPALASASADGRYIAFTTYASLAPADRDLRRDVYVLDRQDGRVTLESPGDVGQGADVDNRHPRVSADGRLLVYERIASSREGAWSDIVLRDRLQGTGIVVSAAIGGERASGPSRQPSLSHDGRVVAFSSAATNLVGGLDANGGAEDIYVFELDTRRVTRVSVDEAGVQPASGESLTPSISGDGRYVVFASTAPLDGAVPRVGATHRVSGIYVRDRSARRTTRVGMAAGARAPDGSSWAPVISADGRYVAFVSGATNLVSADRNRSADVFVTNLHDGAIELVSRRASGGTPANGSSGSPALSADGRFVAFQSDASDLVCGRRCKGDVEDINLLSDVFLLDRLSGTIRRVSGDAKGEWMAPSGGPALDGAGGLVVFSSRQPIDASDTKNDFDLFLCGGFSGADGFGVPRERSYRFHHRHESHALSHGDVLPEDPLDDSAIDPGYVRWG